MGRQEAVRTGSHFGNASFDDVAPDGATRGSSRSIAVPSRRTPARAALNLLVKLAVIVVAAALLLAFVATPVRMNGNEMYPAVRDGDLCVVWRLGEVYGSDVVAYRAGGELRLGRVVARVGDTVDADEAGLLVNGSHPVENVFYPTDMQSAMLPVVVERDEVYVLNDYRDDLSDSRRYGAIPTSDVEGKVVLVLRHRGF